MKCLSLVFSLCLLAAQAWAQTTPAPAPSLLGQIPRATRAAMAADAAKRTPEVTAPAAPNAVKPKPKPLPKKPAAKPAGPPTAVPVPLPVSPPAVPSDEPPAAEAPATAAIDTSKGSVTGLALPRFMSLRFDDVNLRVGPGTRYPIDWVYHRRDLPVEILRELDDWRLVQDQDNTRGWVRAPALSPRRSVVVRDADHTLRAKPADDAAAIAILQPGVIGRVTACAEGKLWCEVTIGAYHGWLKRSDVFGLYPNEAIGG